MSKLRVESNIEQNNEHATRYLQTEAALGHAVHKMLRALDFDRSLAVEGSNYLDSYVSAIERAKSRYGASI